MTKYCVYEFRGNGFVYFGASINPESRKKQHLSAKSYSASSMFAYLNKYGRDSFLFKVLFEFDDPESMRDKERELIKNEKVDSLINKRSGGEWFRKAKTMSCKKLMNFSDGMICSIQDYADKHHEGNFNLAVRTLVKKGLSNE